MKSKKEHRITDNIKKPTRLGEIITESLPTLVVWNLLFILTCIPLITIGPAMAALGFCTNALITDDRPQKSSVTLYLRAFRTTFIKALPIGICFLLVSVFFGFGFLIYSYLMPENIIYMPMASISLLVLAIFWGILAHLVPLLFDLEKTDWKEKQPVLTAKSTRQLIREAGYETLTKMIRTGIALVFSIAFSAMMILFFPATVPLIVSVGFITPALAMAMAHTKSPY